MARIGSLHHSLSATWKYALLGGLASIPCTVASYWQTGDEMSTTAVFPAALVAGYLAKRRGMESSPVGFRTGVVGALPALWIAVEVFDAARALAGPLWLEVAGTLFAVVFSLAFAGLVACLSGVVGWAGGRVGGWLAERAGHRQPPAVGS